MAPHSSTLAWKIPKMETFYAAAAAAKSLQLCPTLCDPIDGSPPGSTIAGILQARTLEWVAISFSNAWEWKVKVKSLSRFRLLATPWTAAYQAPPPMGLSIPSRENLIDCFFLAHFCFKHCLWLRFWCFFDVSSAYGWRRQWRPTPVLLPGESQGRGSLVGCHLWGRTKMDTMKWLFGFDIFCLWNINSNENDN